MIQYGLISKVDSQVLEKTIDLILGNDLNGGKAVYITEIGLYNCGTTNGIWEYCQSKGIAPMMTGIDSEKDKPIENIPFHLTYIKGNSNEVYNQIPDNSQHLCFVDGCHCFAHVISDFFCYAPKVKVGGYFAFHDTGKHIKPFKDFQHGDKNNPDAYISVRKALEEIGLLVSDKRLEKTKSDLKKLYSSGVIVEKKMLETFPGWKLIFDEADSADLAGGICVFRKLY
jgi:hypothetical protein